MQHLNTLPFSIEISIKDSVEKFTKELYYSLFDINYANNYIKNIETNFILICKKLDINTSEKKWSEFNSKISSIRKDLMLDAEAALQKDPAAKSLKEIYFAYPGFLAIAIYRLSHELLILDIPLLPRMMSEFAHSLTGVDIHPGATIGNSFFIDHATGIVIGETTIINNNVSIYQGVTLGGIQVKKELASVKRHPTIESNVTIYANATILGGNVVIGENSIIGANVCITKSIPKNSIVTYKTAYNINPL
ncbi:serine O-acetyltransferase EpsC [Pseudofulvibacter geojedonensis]|uniref:serine O-acetyltransferase n=1 Tax=Pseudofulvibacter geojedonensis TaxID=1123758 RepID=A0ABW3I4T0_9FLAO